jgi:hypothetical protein
MPLGVTGRRMDNVLTTDELEALFVNNAEMEKLAAYLNRFNPIRIMKMEGVEIRHSAILGWLLNPTETHGLGERFLKAFLSEALRGQDWRDRPTAIDIVQADLSDVEVRREWQHIDIFLFSARNQWAFVIENKYFSRQHEGQLAKYAEKVRSIYPNMAVRGVFLTLEDEEPHDHAYVPIGYEAVARVLSRLVKQAGQTLGAEVTTFLNHYIEIIEEETGMSVKQNEAEQLARDLYRQHKKVLEFIWEYGATTDFSAAVGKLCGEDWDTRTPFKVGSGDYVCSGINHYQWSFLPAQWVETMGGWGAAWPGCEGWWARFPLICWLQLDNMAEGTKGKLRLIAEVGPLADSQQRSKLIELIKSVAETKGQKDIRFQAGAAEEGKKFSKFLRNNTLDIDNTQDAKEILDAMIKLIDRFEPCFDAIGEALRRRPIR